LSQRPRGAALMVLSVRLCRARAVEQHCGRYWRPEVAVQILERDDSAALPRGPGDPATTAPISIAAIPAMDRAEVVRKC